MVVNVLGARLKTGSFDFKSSLGKRLRFMAGGVGVFFAVLLPGALWYKAAQRSVATTSARQSMLSLQQQINLAAQSVGAGLDLAGPWLWEPAKNSTKKLLEAARLRRQLPFDIATVFTHDRKFVDGFRTLSKGRGLVDLTGDAASLLFAADSGFFDRVASDKSMTGLITVEERPLLIAVKKITAESTGLSRGFILVGRWLNPDDFKAPSEIVDSELKYYSLASDANLPERIKSIIPGAQTNNGFLFELSNDGVGTLYTLIDDINGRPTLIAELPWQAPWRVNGTIGFGVFFATAAMAGLGTWALLVWGDVRSRRRVRKFDGLASLSVEHIKTLVESFPGYAFALNSSAEYVGVSRTLAGVTGHESAYFLGQTFGAIAGEDSSKPYRKLFTELQDPKRWPRVSGVTHCVEGLGERFEFSGSAHYLAKQDIMLVILNCDPKSIHNSNTQSKDLNERRLNKQSDVA